MTDHRAFDYGHTIAFVPQNRLCVGCGGCAALCPAACIDLRLNPARGLIEPRIDESRCTSCGACLKVCPGRHCDLDSLRPRRHAAAVAHLGGVAGSYVACACDEQIRMQGASGGVLTETLLFLMHQGYIDGAIVTKMAPDNPLATVTYIARTAEDVLAAQGSKYGPVAACTTLKQILAEKGRYAFVGTPCQIAGLRKAQRSISELNELVPCVLGLFCSRTPNRLATEYLLNRIGIPLEEICSLQYRGAGHPGFLRVQLKNGSERKVPHLSPLYWGFVFQHFFKPVRCWLCADHSAELADWSYADNWRRKVLDNQPDKGSSLVVARTAAADELIRDMRSAQRIKADEVSPAEIVRQQALPKKSLVAPRLWLYGKTGHVVPDLGTAGKEPAGLSDILSALPEYMRIVISGKKRHPLIITAAAALFRNILQLSSFMTKISKRCQDLVGVLKMFSFGRMAQAQSAAGHKLLLIGGFGWHDIGDEAMPRADVINFRARLHDVDIVMCSPDPAYTRAYHGERAIKDIKQLGFTGNSNAVKKTKAFLHHSLFLFAAAAQRAGVRMGLWPEARSFLDELGGAAVLFNVGGGNLNSVIPQELYKKGSMYLAACILRKPVIISGQTIGPFENSLDAAWARFCLNRVQLITFRDKETSMQRLRDIGVTKPFCCDAADDAMTLPALSADESKKLLDENVPQPWLALNTRFCVAMNLKASLALFKGADRKDNLAQEVLLMARIADGIIKTYDAKVFFLPTDFLSTSDDRILHRQICSHMAYQQYAACIENEYDDVTLKGLLATADAAIGARYHFCVFAASSLVPFLGLASGIYQQTKLKGLADLCLLPECYVPHDIEFASYEQVWPYVQRFMEKRQAVQQVLSREIPVLKKKSLIGVETACRLLQRDAGFFIARSSYAQKCAAIKEAFLQE